MTKTRFSCEPGYMKLQIGQVKRFNAELTKVLGQINRCYLARKRRNITRKDEYEKITELFRQYGVNEHEVWIEVK